MRNRGESAAEAGRENLYIINGLQKTSPLKGQPQGAEVRAIHAPRAPTRGACAQRQAPLQAFPPPCGALCPPWGGPRRVVLRRWPTTRAVVATR